MCACKSERIRGSSVLHKFLLHKDRREKDQRSGTKSCVSCQRRLKVKKIGFRMENGEGDRRNQFTTLKIFFSLTQAHMHFSLLSIYDLLQLSNCR